MSDPLYGVIDIGSNTIRLVIYSVEHNTIKPMLNKKYSVGLAGYVNEENQLEPQGLERTIEVLQEFRDILRYVRVKEVFPFATASLRNVANSAQCLVEINRRTGFSVALLSGEEEATYVYQGARQSVQLDSGLMVDIGGGSTELIFFQNQAVMAKHSLPIGSLNLYKKFVHDLIPTKKEMKNITANVQQALAQLDLPPQAKKVDTICAIGGTARATQKLLAYTGAIQNDGYTRRHLDTILRLLKDDRTKYCKDLLQSSADRVHTFTPGLIILHTIGGFYHGERFITSQYGVREGYLHSILMKEN